MIDLLIAILIGVGSFAIIVTCVWVFLEACIKHPNVLFYIWITVVILITIAVYIKLAYDWQTGS